MTKDSELRIRLAAAVYRNPVLFKPLAEWLGVYHYILPEYRDSVSVTATSSDPAYFYNVWEFMRVLECSLDTNEQRFVWKLINES